MSSGKNKHALVSAKKPKSKTKSKPKARTSSSSDISDIKDSSVDRTDPTDPSQPAFGSTAPPAQSADPLAAPDSVQAQASRSRLPQSLRDWTPSTPYTRNDTVRLVDKVWICRRSHDSRPERRKGDGDEGNALVELRGYRFWKEDDRFLQDLEDRTGEGSEGGS